MGVIKFVLAYAYDVVILDSYRNKVKLTTKKFLEAGKVLGLILREQNKKN